MATISHHTISLDGFVAGPDDSMDWAFSHGPATPLATETTERIGAIVAGRRWYELALERWDGVEGIYGGAFGGPVFVVTHRPIEGAGERIVVADGLEPALAGAEEAAGGKDVGIFGGSLTQQCLRAGRLDEVVLHVAPVLVGGGVRLFAEDGDQVALERISLGEAEQLTDLRFRVVRD
jgi:dihydrofolate reductase